MSNVIDLRTRRPVEPDGGWSPEAGECLACFVGRMVERAGCTGTLVWAEHWRRLRSPGASALMARLERAGAVCDCALGGVLWSLSPELWEWTAVGELAEPTATPSCRGVRPRSTRPCALWATRAPLTE